MSAKSITFLQKYGEWTFRILLFIGIFLNLWLTSNFVTRGEFELSSKQIKADLVESSKAVRTEFDSFSKDNSQQHLLFQTTISEVATAVKLLAASQVRIDDHETRIRLIEKNMTDALTRLTLMEKGYIKPPKE